MKIKQTIIVRKDLNMSIGKVGSQVAHASMAATLDLLRTEISFDMQAKLYNAIDEDNPNAVYCAEWLNSSFTKICLGVDSLEELEEIEKKCQLNGINHYKIVDEGLTTFNNVPTVTCLSIGPFESSSIDEITGHLKLLR